MNLYKYTVSGFNEIPIAVFFMLKNAVYTKISIKLKIILNFHLDLRCTILSCEYGLDKIRFLAARNLQLMIFFKPRVSNWKNNHFDVIKEFFCYIFIIGFKLLI